MYRTPFLHVSYFYIIRVSLFSLCLEEIFSLKCYNIENSTPSESFFCKDRYLHGYLNEKYLKLAKFDDFEFKFVHFVLFWDQHWFYYPLFWLQATDWTILHEEKVHIQWIHMNKFYVYVLVLSFCHFIRNKQLLYPICYCFSVFWVGVNWMHNSNHILVLKGDFIKHFSRSNFHHLLSQPQEQLKLT